MERWLQQQIDEQGRLRALTENERVFFNGKYWYARGAFDTKLHGTAQDTRDNALQVFDHFVASRQVNIDRAIAADGN